MNKPEKKPLPDIREIRRSCADLKAFFRAAAESTEGRDRRIFAAFTKVAGMLEDLAAHHEITQKKFENGSGGR